MKTLSLLSIVLAIGGCTPSLTTDDRPCPCGAEHICCRATGRCVNTAKDCPAGVADAGPLADTGSDDGGAGDGGSADSGFAVTGGGFGQPNQTASGAGFTISGGRLFSRHILCSKDGTTCVRGGM